MTPEDFKITLLKAFKEEFKEDFPLLLEAYSKGDYEVLRYRSHKIKGSSALVELIEISSICKTIEFQCRNFDFNGLENLISKLTLEYYKLIKND